MNEPKNPGLIEEAVRRRLAGQSWNSIGHALNLAWPTVYRMVRLWANHMGYDRATIDKIFSDVRIGRKRET